MSERLSERERARETERLRVKVSLREEQCVYVDRDSRSDVVCMCGLYVCAEKERAREREIERKTLCNSSRSEAEDSSLEPGVL